MNGTEKASWKRYVIIIFVVLAALAVAIFAGNNLRQSPPTIPSIANATVKSSMNPKVISIRLPYSRNGIANEKLDFNFVTNYKIGESTLFRIIPDDCIEAFYINDKPVTLKTDALAQRCNWRTGFQMDLQGYLHEGANNVHIQIRNLGGPTGLRFTPVRH